MNDDEDEMVNRALAHSPSRRGIQSFDIGLRLLAVLADAGGAATLKEISQAVGIVASKAHRYLASMVEAGFAVQLTSNGRYDLGPRALTVGLAALSRVDAVQTGTKALGRLVEQSGHTAMLAIWSEHGPVIVRWLNGAKAVYTTLSTGSVLPAVQSATGRIFTAFLPEGVTQAVISTEIERLKAQGKAISRKALEEQKKAVRASAFAQISGDFIPGLTAAAAPILNASGEAAAVLTLVGTRDGLGTSALGALKAAAVEASAELGWLKNPKA